VIVIEPMPCEHGALPLTGLPTNVYPTPVSEQFRARAFWFRGLWQKRGQHFAVCGGNPAGLAAVRYFNRAPSQPRHVSFRRLRTLVRTAIRWSSRPTLLRKAVAARNQARRFSCKRQIQGAGPMWVLIVVFLQTGGGFTVPGYSSLEKCTSAGRQTLQDLQPASQTGAQIMSICKRPD
jgi:hypothetical protein